MDRRPQPLTAATATTLLTAHRLLNQIERSDPRSSAQLRLRLLELKRRYTAGVMTDQQLDQAVGHLIKNDRVAA